MFSEHAFAPENTFHAIIIRAPPRITHYVSYIFLYTGLVVDVCCRCVFHFCRAHCVWRDKSKSKSFCSDSENDGSISSLAFFTAPDTNIMKSVPTFSVMLMRVGFYFWSSWFAECIYLEARKSLGGLFWCFEGHSPVLLCARSPYAADAVSARDKKIKITIWPA
jgi:hypothetical protein